MVQTWPRKKEGREEKSFGLFRQTDATVLRASITQSAYSWSSTSCAKKSPGICGVEKRDLDTQTSIDASHRIFNFLADAPGHRSNSTADVTRRFLINSAVSLRQYNVRRATSPRRHSPLSAVPQLCTDSLLFFFSTRDSFCSSRQTDCDACYNNAIQNQGTK